MARTPGVYRLEQDERWLQHWIGEESPPVARIATVRAWLKAREMDPLSGSKPAPVGGPGYRHGWVPGTMDADQRVVTCSYRVDEVAGVVTIDMISTQSWPVS